MFNFESPKIKNITCLFRWFLFTIWSEASWFYTIICICSLLRQSLPFESEKRKKKSVWLGIPFIFFPNFKFKKFTQVRVATIETYPLNRRRERRKACGSAFTFIFFPNFKFVRKRRVRYFYGQIIYGSLLLGLVSFNVLQLMYHAGVDLKEKRKWRTLISQAWHMYVPIIGGWKHYRSDSPSASGQDGWQVTVFREELSLITVVSFSLLEVG